jgi:hypothetical protein
MKPARQCSGFFGQWSGRLGPQQGKGNLIGPNGIDALIMHGRLPDETFAPTLKRAYI